MEVARGGHNDKDESGFLLARCARPKIKGTADLDASALKNNHIGHEFLEDLIAGVHPPEAVMIHG